MLHQCSIHFFNLQYRLLGSEGHMCLQQQNAEDKAVSGYHSRKICPSTRPERYVRLPELEDMTGHQSWKTCSANTAGRHVRTPELEDMSEYQSCKIFPDTRATVWGPELQSTLPTDSPFLPEWMMYAYHRQWIEGLLPKDYTLQLRNVVSGSSGNVLKILCLPPSWYILDGIKKFHH
jgi:hypothetical protein